MFGSDLSLPLWHDLYRFHLEEQLVQRLFLYACLFVHILSHNYYVSVIYIKGMDEFVGVRVLGKNHEQLIIV